MANINSTTKTSSEVTRHDGTPLDFTTIQSVSQTDQQPKNINVTSSDPTVAKYHLSISSQRQTITNGSNVLSETSKCTHSDQETTQATSDIKKEVKNIPVSYKDFPEYTIYKTLGRIPPYVSNIPGFFTNVLTILVATKIKPMHNSELYMFVLGCADLITVSARFTQRIFELYVEVRSTADCKIIWYICTVAQVYSNLILVSWTIERFIAVIFPIKLASWCSVRNTKITAAFLLLFCIAISVPYITESNIFKYLNGREIVSVCNFSVFMSSVWFHIEAVYYICLPIILVCICNLAILYRLRTMTKSRISMASNQETIDKKVQENRKMTILLLLISGTFLCLHIPYAIVMVVEYIYPDVTVLLLEDPHTFAKYLLYTNIGYYVTEFQNSINFFLYCILGNKFRSTFRKTFCKHIGFKKPETTKSSATRSTNF